jgi:hypothetical protein
MVSPAPDNPSGQTQIADVTQGLQARSPNGGSATQRFLDTFGFHLLVVLLGIALAFM